MKMLVFRVLRDDSEAAKECRVKMEATWCAGTQ